MQVQQQRPRARRGFGAAVAAVVIGLIASVAQVGSASADEQAGINIIGGEEAAPGEFSDFMVSLQFRDSDGKWHHGCGGSVLDAQTILTAAHCVFDDEDPSETKLSTMRVVSGIDRLSDTTGAQFRTVAGTWQHPKYHEGNGYDIGYVFLNRPLENVKPVSLPTPGTDALLAPGSKATVIGWGDTVEGALEGSDQLRRVDVPILDQDECTISSEGSVDPFNPETDVCAGVRGKDSCQGDSGGPLFKTIGEGSSRKVYQIGIVSRGEGCARTGAPGIYTYPSAAALNEALGRSQR